MYRLLACVVLICIAPVARASSCDSSNSYDLPNSIVAVAIKDDKGRTENHWIVYRDEYCRAIKTEVLDSKGYLAGYVTYSYDDTGEHARTRLAKVTIDTHAPDGTFLFREQYDGNTVDASGKIVEGCALLEVMRPLPDTWRTPYEQGCQDTRKTPAQGRGS